MIGATMISDGAEGVLDLWPDYGSVIGMHHALISHFRHSFEQVHCCCLSWELCLILP